jgi:hypothetical protein
MARQYILDTSTVRCLSRKNLEEAAQKANVFLPTFSVWELLCHLDEHIKKESIEKSFERQKGQLIKAISLPLLDDPFAAHAVAVGIPNAAHPTRFEDKIMVKKLLVQLSESTTLSDFYSKYVIYPSGERASTEECANRCRIALKNFEDDYINHVQKIYASLLANKSSDEILELSSIEFVQWATCGIRELADFYKEFGSPPPHFIGKILSSAYPQMGYVLARVLQYHEKAKEIGINSITIDPNDAEDSSICLYLDLPEDKSLVTNDTGTIKAVVLSLSHYKKAFIDKMGFEPPIQLTVMNPNEFKRELDIY